jgi:hypothetical protein
MAAHHLAMLGLSLAAGEVLVADDDVPALVAASVMGDLAQDVANKAVCLLSKKARRLQQ